MLILKRNPDVTYEHNKQVLPGGVVYCQKKRLQEEPFCVL